jgi:hypothetical protein
MGSKKKRGKTKENKKNVIKKGDPVNNKKLSGQNLFQISFAIQIDLFLYLEIHLDNCLN